ncbi:3,4-dihydroxyphenylacetaldehyde synthase 2 [Culicoides brevitarsis]|uniref:3,4-dihydroxyphenylacetaldehyde synthase 2 n=1 Tax=Culicoides brevitarsis TaxID=469753 RepID=UPI00307C13BC
MNSQEFREFARAAIDFVADYLDNVRDQQVLPSVEPGYLHQLLPNEMPEGSENWKDVMEDLNKFIMPGITHWQSPNFHAYYPTQTSYPSIVGEIMAAGLGVVGFSWICSPACTELEVIMMNWLGKFINLPESFLNCGPGNGGGVIQGSASECVLVAILTARETAVRRLKSSFPHLTEGEIRAKLVAYSSDQSNSCVEKGGILGAITLRLLPADENCVLQGETLQKAIEEDIARGLIPCICIGTMGTTGTCAFDNIDAIGDVCNEFNVWLHIDAAYAGSFFCLPEYRHLMQGIEKADSLNYNLHKMMLVNSDCSGMWFKNVNDTVESFNVDRIYLMHQYQQQNVAPDYRHYQIALGRRFKALKVWFTLRTYGAEKIREKLRKHIKLAEVFEKKLLKDPRYEIIFPANFGLVIFRMKGPCERTQKLLNNLNESKKLYMVPATWQNKIVLRFVICGFDPEPKDIDFALEEIKAQTENIVSLNSEQPQIIVKEHLKDHGQENQENVERTNLEFIMAKGR